MIIASIIFWVCLLAVFHSYVLFPLIITLIAAKRENPWQTDTSGTQPFVSILISAYNEESVIEDKINSILKSSYPRDKIEIIVGSDCSSDNTNVILTRIAADPSNRLSFFPFKERQGKPNVINILAGHSKGEILILSDANVMFDINTVEELVKPFSDPDIGLVDSQMVNMGMKKEGISHQEKAYISREVRIKHQESLIWGSMMGPFGGCFAIRKSLYKEVPSNFLVDDFYPVSYTHLTLPTN